MARKKNTAVVEPEVKAESEVKEDASIQEVINAAAEEMAEAQAEKVLSNQERMAVIVASLNSKAKEYDSYKEYNEYANMKVVTKDMDDLVKEYNDLSEAETLIKLTKLEKPLVAAAIQLKYETIGYRDVAPDKSEPEHTERQIGFSMKYIDTEKLHKKTAEGVGEDKNWINFLLTARKAYKLGIDPAEINACYSMKQEAKKLEGLHTNEKASDDVVLEDINTVVKQMIGQQHTADSRDLEWLASVYSKKSSKKQLTVTCSNHANMRNHMLDICHRILTGEEYGVDYKADKKALEAFYLKELKSSLEA